VSEVFPLNQRRSTIGGSRTYMPKKLTTYKEITNLLFTDNSAPSRRTWQRWIEKGIVPRIKVGGTNYFIISEVASALNDSNSNQKGSL